MNPITAIRDIRQHPLVQLLNRNKGNPRKLIYMEPLWGIPFNLIAPFVTLYMLQQGITDFYIGIILSVQMVAQVIFGLFGGVITDKLGRKKATMMGDFFGWSLACVIWAISGNFWFFVIAALLNGFEYLNQTAWFCLLIEDADPKDMLGLYTWITIGGLVAVFFAPLSAIFMHQHSLVPVVRVLYVFFAINMLIKVLITWRFCKDTKQGEIRRAETKGVPFMKVFAEYRILIPRIFRNRELIKTIVLRMILHITNLVNASFFGIFITQRLQIQERYLAFFPILNAVVMLIFLVGIQHKLEHVKARIPLWVGIFTAVACQVMLILTPNHNIWLVAVYVFMIATASALIMPRTDAMVQTAIDPAERARTTSLVATITIALASPFGIFAGFLSNMDRRFPYMLTISLFLIAAIVVKRIKSTNVVNQATS